MGLADGDLRLPGLPRRRSRAGRPPCRPPPGTRPARRRGLPDTPRRRAPGRVRPGRSRAAGLAHRLQGSPGLACVLLEEAAVFVDRRSTLPVVPEVAPPLPTTNR